MAADNNKTIAKRKAGNPYMEDNSVQLDNSISPVIAALRSWPSVDLRNPHQVEARLNDYFNLCQTNEVKPGVAGLAMAIGTNRKRLWDIMHNTIRYPGNVYKDIPNATRDVIQKAYDSLEVMWEYSMQSGKINPPCGIFLGKNHFGYQDVVDYNITPKAPEETVSADQLQRRLAALPDD